MSQTLGPHDQLSPMTQLRAHRFAVIALLYALAAIVADLALGHHHNVNGLLAVVPILMAFERNWRWTALSALIPILVVATGLFGYEDIRTTDLFVRVGGVLVAAAFALYASMYLSEAHASLTHTRAVAEAAQRAILPVMPEQLGYFKFSSLYRSSAEESLVGGDFYKIIRSPWGTRMILGDVEGKGLSAVSMSSLVLGCFREWAPRTAGLDDLVAVLDQRVLDYEERSAFVTAVVGTLRDDLTLELANCGHLHPILVRDGVLSTLSPERTTTPLGLGSKPMLQRLELLPRDRLFFFTDGLTETRTSDGQWVALDEVVTGLSSDPLLSVLENVAAQLTARGKLSDDLAMLLIEVSADTQAHPSRTIGSLDSDIPANEQAVFVSKQTAREP
jgi:phosphoserine phosphatase RsbU/P